MLAGFVGRTDKELNDEQVRGTICKNATGFGGNGRKPLSLESSSKLIPRIWRKYGSLIMKGRRAMTPTSLSIYCSL